MKKLMDINDGQALWITEGQIGIRDMESNELLGEFRGLAQDSVCVCSHDAIVAIVEYGTAFGPGQLVQDSDGDIEFIAD